MWNVEKWCMHHTLSHTLSLLDIKSEFIYLAIRIKLNLTYAWCFLVHGQYCAGVVELNGELGFSTVLLHIYWS